MSPRSSELITKPLSNSEMASEAELQKEQRYQTYPVISQVFPNNSQIRKKYKDSNSAFLFLVNKSHILMGLNIFILYYYTVKTM